MMSFLGYMCGVGFGFVGGFWLAMRCMEAKNGNEE